MQGKQEILQLQELQKQSSKLLARQQKNDKRTRDRRNNSEKVDAKGFAYK